MNTGLPAAIVLAGGRASRLGGADKPQLVVGGATLLDHAVRAVSWCGPIIVVGTPASVGTDVIWARESPAFGGPVAAIAAGLVHVDSDEVCIVAADIPRAVDAVALLRAHSAVEADGACLTDETGAAQWLVGRYRTAALRHALDALPDAGHDASIRSLVAGLRLDLVDAEDLAADVDTWDDLERARARAASPATAGSPADQEDS